MKVLFAGPWVGEFGWELFCWQGILREQSKNYDKVIVSSRPHMKILYDDFASEFVPYVPNVNNTDCERNVGFVYNNIHEQYLNPEDDNSFIPPQFLLERYVPPQGYQKSLKQSFVKYGKENKDLKYDVIIHARNKKNSPERNWTLENWTKLVNELTKHPIKIACIGTSDQADYIPPCDNFMDKDLYFLSELFYNSSLLVTPSSGPGHFASLCGCAHLIWSGNPDNEIRYKQHWNPFNTHCVYMKDTTWKPNVNSVYESINKYFKAIHGVF